MSQFMTDHDQIEVWLKTHNIRNYSIHPNGIVDVDGSVEAFAFKMKRLPIQFGTVSRNFDCANNILSSLDGCPLSVGGDFVCHDNLLTSLDNCPAWVGGHFSCHSNNIKSLSGIHKLVKHIGDGFYVDNYVTNILGLMLIDGSISECNIDAGGPIDNIMNKHFHNSRDVLLCQEDLIEAGFAAQAKL